VVDGHVGPRAGTEDLDRIVAAGDAGPDTVGTHRSRLMGGGVEEVRLVGKGAACEADDKLLVLSVVVIFVFAFVFKIIRKLFFF
jgi:hypothetical protein